jgi:hypothetical protein
LQNIDSKISIHEQFKHIETVSEFCKIYEIMLPGDYLKGSATEIPFYGILL